LTQFHTYSELELFSHIAGGDEAAFHRLVNIYNPVLFPGVYRIVKSTVVCEDILQETYLRIWLYRDKLPSIENPRAWILKIAYLRAFSFLRASKNQLRLKENVSEKLSGSFEEMEKSLDFNTLSKVVKTAVSKLPPQQRRVYRLSRESGYSQNEVAELMGLAPQSVKNTMSRALQFIRDYVRKSGHLLLALAILSSEREFFLFIIGTFC